MEWNRVNVIDVEGGDATEVEKQRQGNGEE